MAKWQATARGQATGREFIYEVTGPCDAQLGEVERAALAAHGHNLLLGAVDEVVHPAIEVTEVTPSR